MPAGRAIVMAIPPSTQSSITPLPLEGGVRVALRSPDLPCDARRRDSAGKLRPITRRHPRRLLRCLRRLHPYLGQLLLIVLDAVLEVAWVLLLADLAQAHGPSQQRDRKIFGDEGFREFRARHLNLLGEERGGI
jgi:hypothetical protein